MVTSFSETGCWHHVYKLANGVKIFQRRRRRKILSVTVCYVAFVPTKMDLNHQQLTAFCLHSHFV